MLTELYIEALLVDEELADWVWKAWDKGEICDFIAGYVWFWIAYNHQIRDQGDVLMKALPILLSLMPLVAWSGPDSTSTYLLNEPASLMDLGLLRMELKLNEFEIDWRLRVPLDLETKEQYDAWEEENKLFVSVGVTYNSLEDILLVASFPTRPSMLFSDTKRPPEPGDRQQLIDWCKWTIEDLRKTLNYSPQFKQWFSHYGYSRTTVEQPKNLGVELMAKVRLVCNTPRYEFQQPLPKSSLCRARLTEDAVYCSED